MRKTAFILAAVLLCGATGPARPAVLKSPPKVLRELPTPNRVVVPAVRIGFVQDAAARRGQLAACAKLAATRALDARAMGASFAAQDRILDLAFVLCLAGPQTED